MKKFIKLSFSLVLLASIIFVGWNLYNRNIVLSDSEKNDKIIKVACVGDSITYRHGFAETPENNYPTVLSDILGDNYTVFNYGESGTCVQKESDCAYVDQRVYLAGVESCADVLVLMLGTNDSKPQNWKGVEAYKESYEKLLDSYLKQEKKPIIYICTSPKAFYLDDGSIGYAAFGIQPDVIDQIVEIQREVARERGYQIIDIYQAAEMHPEWFDEDGIHPTLEGARGLAETIAKEIAKDE